MTEVCCILSILVVFEMNRRKWQKFEEDVATKRKKKDRSNTKDSLPSDIMVQRLSPSPSGRLKKFHPLDTREFVSFPNEKFNLENIKKACEKHYEMPQGSCDVLASDRGPSCSRLEQIENKKFYFVRFLSEPPAPAVTPKFQRTPLSTRSCTSSSHPPSVSISTLLKAGQVVKNVCEIAKLQLHSFDVHLSSWKVKPTMLEFSTCTEKFAEGAFRTAHKATLVSHDESLPKPWVLKRYKDEVKDTIKNDLNLTLEEHTKKQVQMHEVARHICSEFRKHGPATFGSNFKYGKVFFVNYKGFPATLEEYFEGNFVKFINNDGRINDLHSEELKVIQKRRNVWSIFRTSLLIRT